MRLLLYKIIKKAKLLNIEDDMKISGQISFLLEVDQNGKLDVKEVNDKWRVYFKIMAYYKIMLQRK